MKALSQKQKKHLKGLAHHLDAVVQVGKSGLSESVLKELVRALSDHELVKAQIFEEDRESFLGLSSELAVQSRATLICTIGRKAVFYKQSPVQEKRKISRALPS